MTEAFGEKRTRTSHETWKPNNNIYTIGNMSVIFQFHGRWRRERQMLDDDFGSFYLWFLEFVHFVASFFKNK